LDSREERLLEMQPAEDESRREELESLKAKLLEMQQSYDESQRTVAELRAHNASLQSDKQQAQETLGLEKLKSSEAAKARETAEERDAALAEGQSSRTAEANTQPAEESRWGSPSGSTSNWPGVNSELQRALNLPIWEELRQSEEQAKQNLEYAQKVHDEWLPQLEAERIKRIDEHKKQEQEALEFKADLQLKRKEIHQTIARHEEELAKFERAFARRRKDQAKKPSAAVESPSNAEGQANERDSTGPEGSALDIEEK
jgi:hypothetical protein